MVVGAFMYQGDGEFDTFLKFFFCRMGKRVRFAKKSNLYGKKGENAMECCNRKDFISPKAG
jgi:hypothetical protein